MSSTNISTVVTNCYMEDKNNHDEQFNDYIKDLGICIEKSYNNKVIIDSCKKDYEDKIKNMYYDSEKFKNCVKGKIVKKPNINIDISKPFNFFKDYLLNILNIIFAIIAGIFILMGIGYIIISRNRGDTEEKIKFTDLSILNAVQPSKYPEQDTSIIHPITQPEGGPPLLSSVTVPMRSIKINSEGKIPPYIPPKNIQSYDQYYINPGHKSRWG